MAKYGRTETNARGENNDKMQRAVVASLSCPPGGAGTDNTTTE